MKSRIIQTRFWDDEINDQIDIYAQHLYLYLLSCKHINMCGYFQIRDNLIKLEAKLTDNQFESAKKQLQDLKKVFFKDGWVWIVNARKNNKYENSPSNVVVIENELSKVSKELIDYFDSSVDSSVDTTQNYKTKNIKHKIEIEKGIVKGKLISNEEKEKVISYFIEKGASKEIIEQEINKFVSYWTEKNQTGTKERWQLERTFEVKKRLATWFNNVNKFSGRPDGSKKVIG